MRLVGLRGFGLRGAGNLHPFFDRGYFPMPPRVWRTCVVNWRRGDWRRMVGRIRSRLQGEEYVLIGFSDGGTLAHEIAAADPYCAGLIVHSGLFRDGRFLTDAPVLLIRTEGDRTPTYDATGRAFEAYDRAETPVVLETIQPAPDWPWNHQFANGLMSMARWCRSELGYELPVAKEFAVD